MREVCLVSYLCIYALGVPHATHNRHDRNAMETLCTLSLCPPLYIDIHWGVALVLATILLESEQTLQESNLLV
jgi:hypothetical protein